MKKCKRCCDGEPPCEQTVCITVRGCLDLPLGGATVTVRKTSDSSLIDDCETPNYVTTPNGTCCVVRNNPGETLDVTITVEYPGFTTRHVNTTLPNHCSTVTLTIDLTPIAGIDPFLPGSTDDPCRFSADCLCGGLPINAPRIDFSTGGGGVLTWYYEPGPPEISFLYYVHNTGVTVPEGGFGAYPEGPAYILWIFDLCFGLPWLIGYRCDPGYLVSADPNEPGGIVCTTAVGTIGVDIIGRTCDPWADTIELGEDFYLTTGDGPQVIYPAGTVITISDDSA